MLPNDEIGMLTWLKITGTTQRGDNIKASLLEISEVLKFTSLKKPTASFTTRFYFFTSPLG